MQARQLHAMFDDKVTTVGTQLAAASRGAIQWDQPAAVEKVYTDFVSSTTDQRLEAFFAVKADQSILWSHNEDPLNAEFLKTYLTNAKLDGEEPQNHVYQDDDHVAVLDSLTDPNTKQLLGYTVTFWNNQHLNTAAIKNAAMQVGVGFGLLLISLAGLTYVIKRVLVMPVNALVNMATKLAGNLDANMNQVHTTTTEMSANARATTQKTSIVLQNSSQTAANVQQVAAGAEELASSLNGVSATVEQTSNLVAGAINEANQSKQVIESLVQASHNISQVTNMISEIAEQTNLLALNASIEAARAGDAGRGFAVVADEIKKLATTTGQATADITKQIKQIAETATGSSKALTSIATSVQRINEETGAIRTAVSEQSTVTQDITRNMYEASTHVQEVDQQLGEVSQAASATGDMSEQLLERIGSLKSDTDRIVLELKTFGKRI
jgi:methyl-accepting chemotaxis protein